MALPEARPAARRHRGVPDPTRTVGLAVCGLVLLGACSPAGDLPSVEPAPSRVPRGTAPASGAAPTAGCPDSGVHISSPGTSAAMGLRALGLELVNCGTEPYRLDGYPVPRLFDGDGDPIPVRVIDGAEGITSGFDDPPRPLILRPGERAGAAVLWRNLVTDPTVVATAGERLEVAPAVGRSAQVVGLDGPIDLGNTGRIGVSAWQKRAADPAPTPTRPLPGDPDPGGSAPSSSTPPLP
ncbi:DUF4232 domain-containing protein [Micromonospora sp. CPCC 205561]|uniref:DUF4232 domain-containing protein n=1 Tax=Micromonospora sp. CPCC 205561 TaxID=3122407 RepID=UPI002FF05297